jgi:hypothetical protein
VTPGAVARAERLIGAEAESWARVVRTGYSLNEHWTATFVDGTRAFLKVARVDPSPRWLRDEAAILDTVQGRCAPRFIAFEDGDEPLLVLEDLMPARWPPPWRDGDVDAVLAALAEVARGHADVPLLVDDDVNGWRAIEADPEPFLSTELRDAAWLERMLPALVAAADAAPLAGDSLLHCDVRSDNLCFKDGHVVLVDWNHARLGNPRFDVALAAEPRARARAEAAAVRRRRARAGRRRVLRRAGRPATPGRRPARARVPARPGCGRARLGRRDTLIVAVTD